MKNSKNKILRSTADKKLLRTNRILRLLILIMGVTVIYNSYQHATPLYYILFFIAGMMVSTVYNYIYTVKHEDRKIKIRANKWNIALTVALIALRFFIGVSILESVQVTWAYDALILFFLGLYFRKIRIIIRQIDNMVYEELFKNKSLKEE